MDFWPLGIALVCILYLTIKLERAKKELKDARAALEEIRANIDSGETRSSDQ